MTHNSPGMRAQQQLRAQQNRAQRVERLQKQGAQLAKRSEEQARNTQRAFKKQRARRSAAEEQIKAAQAWEGHAVPDAQRQLTESVAAGWYADPWKQARVRWWDGQQWTTHTSQ
jgi:hypothetical protein